MPEGNTDDAFLVHATDQLHAHFEITHVTLQVVKTPFTQSCVPHHSTGNSGQAESAHDHLHCHALPADEAQPHTH
jgi:hypothetical protein